MNEDYSTPEESPLYELIKVLDEEYGDLTKKLDSMIAEGYETPNLQIIPEVLTENALLDTLPSSICGTTSKKAPMSGVMSSLQKENLV